MFMLNNRISNALQAIGFSNLNELEHAIQENPTMWKLESILENACAAKNTSRVERKDTSDVSITRNEFDELKRQVDLLRLPLGDSRKAK